MEQKFTTLAQDAVRDAVQSAAAAGNAQVDTLHLADALLRQEQGVVRALIAQAGADAQQIGAEIRNALVALPSSTGSTTTKPDASRQLLAALSQAEKEMRAMGDEYVSTEHMLLAWLRVRRMLLRIFSKSTMLARSLCVKPYQKYAEARK